MLGHGHRLQMFLRRSVHRVDDVNQQLLAPFINANCPCVAAIFVAAVFVAETREN